jgi:hypothetical protein
MKSDSFERSPAEIESRIEQKRASLDRKLTALEHKLSPREQLQRVKDQVDTESLLGWAAVGAVATGAIMAVNGWRRHHNGNGRSEMPDDYAALDDLEDLEEIVILDGAAIAPEK